MKHRVRQKLIIFAGAFGVLLAASAGFLAWCFFGSGFTLSNYPIDEIQEFPSPGGGEKAVLYRVDNYSWQICIVPVRESLPRWRRPIFTTDGDLVVSARWTDSSHLVVVYGPPSGNDRDGEVGRRIPSFGEVKIAYHYVP